MRAAVVTHRRPADTSQAVRQLMEVARRRRVTLCFTPDEANKHGIELGPFVEIVPDSGPTSTCASSWAGTARS